MTRTFTAHKPGGKRPVVSSSSSQEVSAVANRKKIVAKDLERALEARLQREKELMEGLEQKKEIVGPQGLEPTRYGDWERKGICVDF